MVDLADLKEQILLKDLNDEELRIIAERVVEESYPLGKLIFMEGEETVGIYLIKKGRVEISKTTPDGWKQTLAVLSERHFFGELSVIEDKKEHGAIATAIDNTDVFVIKKEDLKSLEKTNPELMYKIMKTIARVASRNVHTMNEKLVKLLISY
ncbi:MAG TPA: cyclic nucleotide-binding domain-containing protein [Nitrospirae bacterium]|nr:cyclic nucleotide-binding domain-containing protein [Nitrospirota bacterium]